MEELNIEQKTKLAGPGVDGGKASFAKHAPAPAHAKADAVIRLLGSPYAP